MSAPVALVIGAGPNIGAAVARVFAAKRYKLALASRSSANEMTSNGTLQIEINLGDPESVKALFEKVVKNLGAPQHRRLQW